MEGKTIRYLLLMLFALVAELIDGGLGMGYGVSLTTFLLSLNIGTAVVSASVHLSEIPTTLASGISHFKVGNFDKKIFTYLAVPGIIGGIIGAYIAVKFQDITFIKPFISGILMLLGMLIIRKNFSKKDVLEQEYKVPKRRHLIPLGFIASFVDAVGGGGWGPIATPALMIGNAHPRKTIGSVNFAEFFVTLSISLIFLLTLPRIEWIIVIPMIIGGVIAAPFAAIVTKKLPHKTLGIVVGCLIIFLNLRIILKSIGIGFLF